MERVNPSRQVVRFGAFEFDLQAGELRRKGAMVDVVPVYRTVLPETGLGRLKEQLQAGGVEIVTFTSSSTVSNFVELLGGTEEARRLVRKSTLACIVPITARTAEQHGLPVTIMPGENTVPALAQDWVRSARSNAKEKYPHFFLATT